MEKRRQEIKKEGKKDELKKNKEIKGKKKKRHKSKERNNKDWKIKKGLYPYLNEKHATYQRLKKINIPSDLLLIMNEK